MQYPDAITSSLHINSAGQEVTADFERHGVFVGKHAFDQCFDAIWQWIDVGSLTGQLMKHQLVTNPDTAYYIRSLSIAPRERVLNLLLKIAPQAGSYGFHLLYMCIRDARENLGHQDAAEQLKQYGNCILFSVCSRLLFHHALLLADILCSAQIISNCMASHCITGKPD